MIFLMLNRVMGIGVTLTGLRHCQVGVGVGVGWVVVTCQAAKLLTVSLLPNCKSYCAFSSIN